MSATITDVREGRPSASNLDRLVHCPGSLAAERGMPELPTQAVTEEGSAIHAALETGDDTKLEMTEREIKSRLIEIEDTALGEWMSQFDSGLHAETHHEKRLWIRNRATLDKVASAQLDIFHVLANQALVIDTKTGFADATPSERNWQLKTQAVALWQAYPAVERVRVAIAHVRLTSKFDACEYSLDDLRHAEREVLHAVWRTEQPDAPRVPGSHCRYCRAQGVCREMATWALVASHADAMPVADELGVALHVGKMTPGELAYVHSRKRLANVLFDAVSARMKTLPTDVLTSIGYELAPGVKRRDITDVTQAFLRLKPLLQYEKSDGQVCQVIDERMQCVKISRTTAADLLAKRTDVAKKKAQALIDEAIGDAMVENEGEPRLKQL